MQGRFFFRRALAIYGILTGIVLPFILFPGTITNSLSVLLLPAISRASGKKDNHHVRQTTSVTVRYSLLLGVLTCAVFLNYGMDLGQFVFHSENARKTFDAACFFMPISICDNNFRQHYQWTRENGNHFCFYRNWSYHSNWLPVFLALFMESLVICSDFYAARLSSVCVMESTWWRKHTLPFRLQNILSGLLSFLWAFSILVKYSAVTWFI